MRIRTVQFGLTDACNMTCLMCTRERAFAAEPGRRPGFMDLELFKKTCDELADSGNRIDLIFLAWIGESLLHPDFPAMVEHLARMNVSRRFFDILAVNTNGSRVHPQFTEAMIAAAAACPGLRVHVAFSLDAWHPETHQRIKGRNDGLTVRSNVEKFLRRNKEAGHPVTVHLSALVLDENHAELGDFIKHWSTLLTELNYSFKVSHDAVDPGDARTMILLQRAIRPDQPAADRLHRQAAETAGLVSPQAGPRIVTADSISKNYRDETIFASQTERQPCPALWQYPTIHWDGRVTLCCKDTDLALVVGDLRQNTFAEIWNHGQRVELYRRWHLEGKFHLLPECATCGNYDVEAITSEDLSDSLQETELAGLIDWLGQRSDLSLMEKLNEFIESRPDRWPELEKAADWFQSMDQLQNAEKINLIRKESFARFLLTLRDRGQDDSARSYLQQSLEDHVNRLFSETVREYQTNGEIQLLESLLELDLIGFAQQQIPGLPEPLLRLTDLEILFQQIRDKFGIYRDVGNHWYRTGNHLRALPFYSMQLERDSEDLSSLKQTAFCAYHLDRHPESLSAARKVLSIGPDFEMERLLGHIFLEESQFETAAGHFSRAVKLDGTDWLSKRGLLVSQHRLGADNLRNLALHVLETAPADGDTMEVREILGKQARGNQPGI